MNEPFQCVRRLNVVPNLIRTFGLIAFVAILVACSRNQFLYNNADWFIARYADGYLDLSGEQQARWEPLLDHEIATHKREDLPQIIEVLTIFERQASEGADEDSLECLFDEMQLLYDRLAHRAVSLAVPLLATLDEDQIDHLEEELAEAHDDYRKRYLDPDVDARLTKRAERLTKRVARFTRPLSETQQAMVRQASRTIPDPAQEWFDYKRLQQQRLLQLLRQGADENRLRHHLTTWWVDGAGQPPVLDAKVAAMRRQSTLLLLQIDASLTAEQRQSLVTWVSDLRADLQQVVPPRQLADAIDPATGILESPRCPECPCPAG